MKRLTATETISKQFEQLYKSRESASRYTVMTLTQLRAYAKLAGFVPRDDVAKLISQSASLSGKTAVELTENSVRILDDDGDA